MHTVNVLIRRVVTGASPHKDVSFGDQRWNHCCHFLMIQALRIMCCIIYTQIYVYINKHYIYIFGNVNLGSQTCEFDWICLFAVLGRFPMFEVFMAVQHLARKTLFAAYLWPKALVSQHGIFREIYYNLMKPLTTMNQFWVLYPSGLVVDYTLRKPVVLIAFYFHSDGLGDDPVGWLHLHRVEIKR